MYLLCLFLLTGVTSLINADPIVYNPDLTPDVLALIQAALADGGATNSTADSLDSKNIALLDSNQCTDIVGHCDYYKKQGYCNSSSEYYSFVAENCVKTCELACQDCRDFPGRVVVAQTGERVARPEGSTTFECSFDLVDALLETLSWHILRVDEEDVMVYEYSFITGKLELDDRYSHILTSPEAPQIEIHSGSSTVRVHEHVKDQFTFQCTVRLITNHPTVVCSAKISSNFEDLPVSIMLNNGAVYTAGQDSEFCSMEDVPDWHNDYSNIKCKTRSAYGPVFMEVRYQMIHEDSLIGMKTMNTDEPMGDVTLAAQFIKPKTKLSCLVHDLRGTTRVECKLPSTVPNQPPVGSIIAWSGDSYTHNDLLSGWQFCDGTLINSGPMNGSRTPNLNGEKLFLRGGDAGSVLTKQSHQMQSHSHNIQDDGHKHTDSGHTHAYVDTYFNTKFYTNSQGADPRSNSEYPTNTKKTTGTSRANISTDKANIVITSVKNAASGTETRPANMAVIWIMRIF